MHVKQSSQHQLICHCISVVHRLILVHDCTPENFKPVLETEGQVLQLLHGKSKILEWPFR